MPAPVVVEFLLRGMPAVQNAFRTVEQAASASERARTTGAQRGTRERLSLADREAKEKIRAAERTARDQTRQEQSAARQSARVAKEVERETTRIQRAITQNLERETKRRTSIIEHSATMAGQIARREADREIAEQKRKDREREQSSRRFRETFWRGAGGAISSGASAGVSRVAGRTLQTAGLVTQLGGGFSISDSVARAAHNAGAIQDILNEGLNPVSKVAANRKRRTTADIESGVQGTAIQYGMSREEVQGGLFDIVGSSGDLETGTKILPKIAELSRATGADFKDMANAAAKVSLSFDDMTDSGEKAEKVMQVMRTLAGQGKTGAVPIRANAVQAAKLIAASGQFAGDNADNIAKIGALQQMGAMGGGAWNAASASTAVTAFTSTFGKPARLAAFHAAGITDKDIFADEGKTRLNSVEEIILKALKKTGGSQPEMTKMFGSVMAMRAVTKSTRIYTEAEGKEKGGGEAKVREFFKDIYKNSTVDKKEVTELANERMKALDAQMASTQEKFDKAVQDKIIPRLLDLVPVLDKLVPMFVDLNAKAIPAFVELIKTVANVADEYKGWIGAMAAHPVATVIVGSIAKEGIGAAAAGALSTAIGSQAGVIGAAAAGAIVLGIAAMDKVRADIDAARSKSVGTSSQAFTEAKSIEAKIADGTAGAADMERLKTLKAAMSTQTASEEANVNKKDIQDIAFSPFALMDKAAKSLGISEKGSGVAESEERSQKDREERLKQSRQAVEELDKAMEAMLKKHAATATSNNAGDKSATAGAAPAPASTGIVQRSVK